MAERKGDNQKLKMLYLAKIFSEESDDDHYLTMPEIIKKLAAYGVNADRKTIYQDIAELKKFGMDILTLQEGRSYYYFLGGRDFEMAELKLLVDAVQSSKFISESKSRELIKKLEDLVSKHQATQLHRQVLIAGRVKTMNESIYYNVDKLHAAINSDRKIKFRYYDWNLEKKLQPRYDGMWYQMSPWALIWDDEMYYLVVYDTKHDKVTHYRVDKMKEIEILDDHHFRGWMLCTPKGGGWGNGKGKVSYTLYFYGESSASLKNCYFYSADIPDDWERKRDEVVSTEYLARVADAAIVRGRKSLDGKHIGVVNEFRTKEGEAVEVKVGISYVDERGAYQNFMAEVAEKDFDGVWKAGREMWNEELSRIEVSGGSEDEKTVLYTSLYHSCLDPRVYVDVDGRYIGGDLLPYGADPSFTKRILFSGWDVFRSQFPLMTIINPRLVSDMINSLISLAEQSRRFYFERWELLNSYSGCMLGNPALSVIADA